MVVHRANELLHRADGCRLYHVLLVTQVVLILYMRLSPGSRHPCAHQERVSVCHSILHHVYIASICQPHLTRRVSSEGSQPVMPEWRPLWRTALLSVNLFLHSSQMPLWPIIWRERRKAYSQWCKAGRRHRCNEVAPGWDLPRCHHARVVVGSRTYKVQKSPALIPPTAHAVYAKERSPCACGKYNCSWTLTKLRWPPGPGSLALPATRRRSRSRRRDAGITGSCVEAGIQYIRSKEIPEPTWLKVEVCTCPSSWFTDPRRSIFGPVF